MVKNFKLSKSITDRSDEILNRYFKEVSRLPMIDSDTEKELAVRIQKGDIQARNTLVNANLRFVISVAKQYQGMGIPLIDLINAGNEGLITAAEKFLPEYGYKFISYAVWWIRQSITQSLFLESRVIRVPVSQTSFLNKINKAAEDFEKVHERTPSNKELAKILNTTESKIVDVLLGNLSCTSFDVSIKNDENDSGSLLDIIPNKNIDGSDHLSNISDSHINLGRLLNKFPNREQDILRMVFGLEGVQQLTFDEIGKRFGLTGERIRQIKERILETIRVKYSDLAKELL